MLFGTPSLLSFQFFVIVFYTCLYRGGVKQESQIESLKDDSAVVSTDVDVRHRKLLSSGHFVLYTCQGKKLWCCQTLISIHDFK